MSAFTDMLRTRWAGLAARERLMVIAATALVAVAVVWWLLLGPAIATTRAAAAQHRVLDAQLQRMMALQAQAQALQSQPKQGFDESVRQLELATRQRLGATGRMTIAGDRVTITLTGTAPDALAQWLTQARVNARAAPVEAHLLRSTTGLWEGNLVLTLPPRS